MDDLDLYNSGYDVDLDSGGGGFDIGNFFGDIFGGGDASSILTNLGDLFAGKNKTFGKAGSIGGMLGLAYLLNKMSPQQQTFAGYKGKIPEYTATRTQTPYSTTTTTTPEGQTAPRRPGSSALTYFQPVQYTKAAADGGLMSGYPSEPVLRMAEGGIASLGSYSDGGRLLKGPGDGVSDSIPAVIGERQPARLADGEFVIPARIVSELGNGSTEAGAKKLYAMMDRVQKARGKSIGKDKVAVNSKADKHLPA
jgi:hypothetical protein